MHKHIQDLFCDLNYSSADIYIFTETRFSLQDTDEMYYIPGYELFRNDNSYSSNASRPYGGTAVYSRIPYLPRYPCCNNIHGIELTVIKITSLVDWTIIGIYRSPKAIAETLNSIMPDHNIIILGDLNINWLLKKTFIQSTSEG